MYTGVGYSPIRITNHADKEVTILLHSYLKAIDEGPGSRVYLRDGSQFVSKETATQVETLIQAQIDAWLAAFPA